MQYLQPVCLTLKEASRSLQSTNVFFFLMHRLTICISNFLVQFRSYNIREEKRLNISK